MKSRLTIEQLKKMSNKQIQNLKSKKFEDLLYNTHLNSKSVYEYSIDIENENITLVTAEKSEKVLGFRIFDNRDEFVDWYNSHHDYYNSARSVMSALDSLI